MASVALFFGVSTAAMAQETDYAAGHNFITLQGGAQTTFTNYDFSKLITPQVAISAGRYFNDQVGARLHVMGWENKGGFPQGQYNIGADTEYKFKACTADLDLLVNMSNVFNRHRTNHSFDWVLLAGFGVNYGWDFDEYKALTSSMKYYYEQAECGTKHASFNGRLGTQFNWNISDAVTLGLELQANYKNDTYNLKHNYECDWQVVGLIGLTYNFGYKHKAAPKPEPEPVPVVIACPGCNDTYSNGYCPESEYAKCKNNPNCSHSSSCKCKQDKPAPAPVVKKEEPLKETIFYQIRLSDPSEAEETLNKVVAWCNEYPAKSISISGYADKGTGNERVNKMYAEQRATKVADALRAKGVDADRMSVNSYGDTVQPYAENDLNRCVIIIGE